MVEHVRVFFAEGFGARGGRVRAAPPTAASGSSAARPAPRLPQRAEANTQELGPTLHNARKHEK